MSIACIVIPHFALRVALLNRPELDGAPLLLGPAQGERPIVYDATPEAAMQGVRTGLGLREAVALCPEAVILTPHPVRESAAIEQIVTGLERLSPAVESDPGHPGCYAIDLTGLDRLLGPPSLATERLLATVPALLRPRAGVAPNKFTARVAAYEAAPGTVQVVDPTLIESFLATAPISLLPLSSDKQRRLERLGLRTLGDLAALPPAAVQARFGAEGRRAWELARGNDREPVHPRLQPETVSESLTLPAPATSRETLVIAITRLVLRAFDRAALRNRHVRQARLHVSLEGGQAWEQITTLREPGGHKHLIEALGYRLQALALPGPVEALTLEISGLIDATSRQELLPGFHSRRPWQLAEASRHLKQRFGTSGLYRVVEVEPWSRLPERRRTLIAYDP
ncbi:MAG: DNA polymerase Y family protein [Chloroflexota bacterium]|nr:DNA polymerase Y family protein [Chloroflexota bacterium]